MDTSAHGAREGVNANRPAAGREIDAAAETAHDAIDHCAAALQAAAASLATQGEDARQLRERALTMFDALMRDKPLQAMSLAALAGFLLARPGDR